MTQNSTQYSINISDELLAEYYFDQHQNVPMDATARAALSAAISRDPELAARYAGMQRQMHDVRGLHEDEKMPDATRLRLERNFARHVRLQEKDQRPTKVRWLLAAAGIGAVMAISLQNLIAPGPGPTVGSEHNSSVAALDPLKPFSAHMLDAQTVLANLSSAPRLEQQQLLEELIAQNRAFAQRAGAQGLPDVQRVLQALEPVFTELSRANASPERKQLLDQLDFETRVLANRWHVNNAQAEQTKIEL